jgi:hypothetical protein
MHVKKLFLTDEFIGRLEVLNMDCMITRYIPERDYINAHLRSLEKQP